MSEGQILSASSVVASMERRAELSSGAGEFSQLN